MAIIDDFKDIASRMKGELKPKAKPRSVFGVVQKAPWEIGTGTYLVCTGCDGSGLRSGRACYVCNGSGRDIP